MKYNMAMANTEAIAALTEAYNSANKIVNSYLSSKAASNTITTSYSGATKSTDFVGSLTSGTEALASTTTVTVTATAAAIAAKGGLQFYKDLLLVSTGGIAFSALLVFYFKSLATLTWAKVAAAAQGITFTSFFLEPYVLLIHYVIPAALLVSVIVLTCAGVPGLESTPQPPIPT